MSKGSLPEELSIVSDTSARTLGAQHPGHGVDDVGLAAAVGADHDRDARLELENSGVGEGLETLHAEGPQEHRSDPTNPRAPAYGPEGLAT
jgi:hypothetical protein